MRVAAMAGVAGDFLGSNREHASAREIRVDLARQQDHLAGNVLARVDVELL